MVGVALGVGGPPVDGVVPPGGVAWAGGAGVPAPPVFVGPAGAGAGVGSADGGPVPSAPPICAPGPGACGAGAGMGVPALVSVWFRLPAPPAVSPVACVGGSVAGGPAGAVIGDGDAIRFSTTLLKTVHPRVDPRVPNMS